MLAVSAEFLQAIKNKAPQDIRLEFVDGSVIGKADIAATSGGLTYTEILNGDTDMTFGRAVMAELNVALVNTGGKLTEFDFTREFTAKFGVGVPVTVAQVTHSGTEVTWTDSSNSYVYSYSVYSTSQIRYRRKAPNSSSFSTMYLSCSNAAIVIAFEDQIYAVGSAYTIIKAWRRSSVSSHAAITIPSEFPAGITDAQVREWVDAGISVRVVEGTGTQFEYIPLGVFKGERPEKVRGKLIDFTAHDRMSLFDKSAETFADGLTFPCTLGEIYTKLCDFCGVGYVSAAFTNSDKSFDTNPLEGTDYTCREILAYIAEAAGSYARMSRDGAVELVWFATADHTVTRTDRFEMTESEFETPPIDRLEVYNSYGDQLNTSGTGDIVYGISDNPFLYIENDTQLTGLQPYVDAIYNRIATFPAYQPSSFRAECNPAVQCGDIIRVVDDYDETISFPVFMQTITWSGYAKVTYENTGGMTRQNAPIEQRELEQLKKRMLRDVDLYTSIDSYLNTQEGIASITQAVSGTFVTKRELGDYVTSEELGDYVKNEDLGDFVMTSELDARIEAYINGEEGIASITEKLTGTFVLEDELGDFATKTEVATSITQEINRFGATLKLEAKASGDTVTTENVYGDYSAAILDDGMGTVGEMFGFSRTNDGYYTSENAGVDSSFSYGYWHFSNTSGSAKRVVLRCISYGESSYDYGLVSELNTDLSFSYEADTSGVLYSFRGKSSADPVDIPITVPTGDSYITFKYIKDSSQAGGNDYFKFIALEVTTTTISNSSTITLTQNGIEQSSVDIVFNGFVTFNDLAQEGSTTINGANVTTENLNVENVFLGGDNSRKILTSNLGTSGGTVDIGFIENYGSSSYGKVVKIYADFLYVVPPGGSELDDECLIISPKSMYFGANSSDWTFDV